MFDFEKRERDDENEASKNYQSIYHGYPIMEYWDSEFFELVKAHFKPGDRILDLGCGPESLWPYCNPDKDKEFLAYLKVAAIEIEKHLSRKNRRG